VKQRYILALISWLLIVITACNSNTDVENEPSNNETKEADVVEVDIEPAEIDWSDYSEEMGFKMDVPPSEVATTFSMNGTVEEVNQLQEDYVWVIIRKKESIEEIDNREIEYYIPIDGDQFNADLNLPNGEGEYRVTVRLPATDRDNYFYDTATFDITNLDQAIARDIEFTRKGLERELQFNERVNGWNEASEVFEIEGTVSDSYDEPALLAEVKKDGEESMIAIPIENGTFKGEIPLYFGEGTHEILINLYTDDEEDRDGTYYNSALFYVHNASDKILPEITQYGPYIERGLMLDQPSWNMSTELDSIEYPVKGTINPDAPLADTVSHVIVEMQHSDDRKDKATYYFPVEDYSFEGIAHFRFGSGEYKVTIYVPDEEQEVKNEFHYTSALELSHEVKGIDDQRDLLPSRGVESDSPIIIEQAEDITDGLTKEREKAKAIYKFVAENVSYDVEKFKEDIFHPDDSAVATLESGSGICQDYAFLTLALLRSIDIESRYVQGYAGGRHAWVEAKVDGEWIEMDPTWGAGYVDGDEFHFKYNEDYFDPDPEFLEETHTRYDLLY